MNCIKEYQGIGDLYPVLVVRRSARLSDQMANQNGSSGLPVDLTGVEGDFAVADLMVQGIVDQIQKEHGTNVPIQECGVGNDTGKIRLKRVGNDGDVGVKEGRKRSRYYIVANKKFDGEENVTEKVVGEEGAIKKLRQKGVGAKGNKKFRKGVVGEETGGVGTYVDEVLGKKLKGKQVHKNDKMAEAGKVPHVDRLHVRVSLWSLHRLITNLSQQQRKAIIEMGFGCVLDFGIKDVPTRLGYWVLDNFNEETCVLNVDGKAIPITRETIHNVLGVPMGNVYVQARDEADFRHQLVIEWKKQFGKKDRYYHGPLEQLMYTQTDGGFWFKINFLVLYFTSIGESNKNATCNLRFLQCINDETAINKFDWCTFILECLVRTKQSWIRWSHYTGPVIVLLIVYANSVRNNTVKHGNGVPLVNNWTVDMLNKLEDERFSANNVEELKKSVADKLKKCADLIGDADYELNDALEQYPHDADLIQLRDLRDVLFGSRTYNQPAKDGGKPNEVSGKPNEDCGKPDDIGQQNEGQINDVNQTDDEVQYTQLYGTPSAYIAYAEEVELEWTNKQKRLRSDNVTVSKFDLSLTGLPDTTPIGTSDVPNVEGFRTPETVQVVGALADVPGNRDNIVTPVQTNGSSCVTPYNICDAKPLQSIPPKVELRRTKRIVRPAEVLRSPYAVREVYLCGAVTNHEKRAAYCLFSGRFNEADILFKTENVNGPRGVLETLCPSIKIASGVIDIFTKVLNHAEMYRDPVKMMRRVFCETSMMHEWDVNKYSAKGDDVKESSDKFNASMLSILKTTQYRNLHNVDLVFFPIIQGSHFFVICINLKWKQVEIMDNIFSYNLDVSERCGDVVGFLVARFLDYLAYEKHPALGAMRNAVPKILALGCRTQKNFIDCGVFVMRHMETYMGGGDYNDLCELRRESKAQKQKLDELRIKYAAKILLSDINKKKSDFEVEAEAYWMLPFEERQRLEDGAIEAVKARATRML